jgi:3-phenylpropionate/cinnamic acid dioxygenase small subunit
MSAAARKISVDPAVHLGVADLLNREAAFLDEQRWDEWLALFEPDCEYWLMAWDSEHELARDPKTEISLIYYDSRAGLEDRVLRIRSGLSAAATPLPRTCHLPSNVRVAEVCGDELVVHAKWQTHAFRRQQTATYYGSYEYRLRKAGDDWRIARKKIVLLNDVLYTSVDIYNI